MNPYTVVLLLPDYARSAFPESITVCVEAWTAAGAVRTAQQQTWQGGNINDIDDLLPLSVFEGHHLEKIAQWTFAKDHPAQPQMVITGRQVWGVDAGRQIIVDGKPVCTLHHVTDATGRRAVDPCTLDAFAREIARRFNEWPELLASLKIGLALALKYRGYIEASGSEIPLSLHNEIALLESLAERIEQTATENQFTI